MPAVVFLLTSLVFAVHALLGCGIHHACEYGAEVVAAASGCEKHGHSHEHCHHGGHPPHEHEPCEPCAHASCSYVKAETQQVSSLVQMTYVFMLPAVEPYVVSLRAGSVRAPEMRGDCYATELYVWHCALII